MVPTLLPFGATSGRDELWEHCRNSLGIARLLVHEQRPNALIATACHLAVETACRAALSHTGRSFEGDVGQALGRLAAPAELCAAPEDATPAERLDTAERLVAWMAAYLRREAPGGHWGD